MNLKVQIRASGPDRITVLPPGAGMLHLHTNSSTTHYVLFISCNHYWFSVFYVDELGVQSLKPVQLATSGYYYQGSWMPLDGAKMHQFNDPSVLAQCLKNKVINMFGDSTVRQWFEYLIASVPGWYL